MSESMRRPGWPLLVVLALTASANAQIQERPEVKQLSREELARRQSEAITREAQSLFGLGIMRHRSDNWLEAVQFLEQAAKLDPATPAADRALIPLYLSLARQEDALDACRRVLHLDPNDCGTSYEMAKLLKAEGRFPEAIAALSQGANSPRAEDRPDLKFHTLTDLADLQEKTSNFAAAAVTWQRLAAHLLEQQSRLIGSDTLSAPEHAQATARAYEKAGGSFLQLKQFSDAIRAYEQSRDFLAKHPDPEIRRKAVRLNWNLAQTAIAQDKWKEASAYLDAYLENLPSDPEPYEKKLAALRKLDRADDVIPTIKRLAGRVPDALGVQLLYARELSNVPSRRGEVEAIYIDLAIRFGTADVYRGMFRFYVSNDKTIGVLDELDAAFTAVNSKDEVPADERERARERGRAMLQVLRKDTDIASALVTAGVRSLKMQPERKVDIWQLLAALGGRTKQYDKSETLYRHCLSIGETRDEASLYGGLLEVLWLQHKHDAIVALCREAIDGTRKVEASNLIVFHRSLALALSHQGKADEALAECDKAIKLATEPGQIVAERCRKVRILAKADKFEAAVAECETLLKESTQAGDIKQVRYALSSIHSLKGDHEKSEAQLLKILESDPNDPGANNDLGYQWADRGQNLDEAERMIRKAIEVDRIGRRESEEELDNAAYLDSLGWVLFRKGKIDEAREWLEKAASLHLGTLDPTVHDHLGDVYWKLNLSAKAKEAWTIAVKLYDHDERGKKEGRQEEARKKLKMVKD